MSSSILVASSTSPIDMIAALGYCEEWETLLLKLGFQPTESKDGAEVGKTSGRFKVTSSIVIMLNLEFNSMCPKEETFLFHWNTLMWPGLLTQIWMCWQKNEKMIIGMWTRIEVYQTLGKDSTKFTSLREKPPKGCLWSGGETDENSSNCQTWECVAWSMDPNWESRSKETKARVGNWEAKTR